MMISGITHLPGPHEFANRNTWEMLECEMLPLLEKIARSEFRAIGFCDIDDTDITEIKQQAGLIKGYICSYIDGLAQLHCI